MVSAVMLGTSLNKKDNPCERVSLRVFIKVVPNSRLVSPASPLLQSTQSAYRKQNGCSCARTLPQESLSDVSDWEALPIRGWC